MYVIPFVRELGFTLGTLTNVAIEFLRFKKKILYLYSIFMYIKYQ